MVPGKKEAFSIEKVYNKEHAFKVIEAAMQDYVEYFGG
jgi:hypothetical protein